MDNINEQTEWRKNFGLMVPAGAVRTEPKPKEKKPVTSRSILIDTLVQAIKDDKSDRVFECMTVLKPIIDAEEQTKWHKEVSSLLDHKIYLCAAMYLEQPHEIYLEHTCRLLYLLQMSENGIKVMNQPAGIGYQSYTVDAYGKGSLPKTEDNEMD